MAIPSRQIGWGTEDNLLWQISKQLERLTCVTAGGCGSITTTTTSSTTAAPVYRVFTALLTQSGGDFLDQLDYSTPTQNVTKGVTYNIATTDIGADFTNVGAPNNEEGTYFVAINNEIPNSWGESEGSALIFNTGAPVVNVLENTIGNIWWEYQQVGGYLIKSNALFTENKTILFASSMNNGNDTNNHTATGYTTPNQLSFRSWGNLGDNYAELDNTIPLPIEIRVYN